jgi:hypothetical protein
MSAGLSLEERVNIAYRWLTLIQAATNVNADEVAMDSEELAEAILIAAHDAREALEPLRHVPAKIGNWTAPDGERDAAGGTPVTELPAGRRLRAVAVAEGLGSLGGPTRERAES